MLTSTFYFQTSLCVALWWIVVSSATRRPLFQVTQGSVVTIPSLLPTRLIMLLQQYRANMFYGETIGLALASSFPEYQEIRIVAAVLYTLYHLTESSESNRHGEYPVLYTMWTMCVLPNEEYRQAGAWGIAIHFLLSAGYSKIAVGGVSDWGIPSWFQPSTMQTYLSCYRTARHRMNRPLFPFWSQAVAESKVLCTLIAVLTIGVECVGAPATLLLDAPYRPYACYAMIGIHIGIACIMSLKVGIVFWTTLPVYLYGFGCTTSIGSAPWHLAVAMGLGPTLFSIFIMPLAENWPLSPVSLFMWNGGAARRLERLLMTGDTRIVLATASVASNSDLIGLQVIHHGESHVVEHTDIAVVHDCLLRVIGFTMVQGSGFLVETVRALEHEKMTNLVNCNATKTLVHQISAWLSVDGRLVEAHTGEPLTHAYLVRVDDTMRVSAVLV